jgi:phosphoserine phosphatase
MHFVATFISARARPALDIDALESARTAIGLGVGQAAWLEMGVAADIALPEDATDAAEMTGLLRNALGGRHIDVVVQPADGRKKHILIADMDSTMIGQECIDELAAEIGLKAHVAAITEKAMRGKIAFEPALRERVLLLKGLPETIAADVIKARITLTPGARTLVQTMRANGAYTALVSGGFTHFTRPIAAMIGFHETRANELIVDGGRLTGHVSEPILGATAKRDHLLRLTRERDVPQTQVLAVGDGANDLPMIREAGMGVAYHAKPAVAAEASACIEHADLTALLFMQGYAATAFVEN